MTRWLHGIRGAVLLILIWLIGWALGFGGIMEIIDSQGKIQDVWPTLLAVPGLIGGILFSGFVVFGEGGRSLSDITVVRFVLWGAVTGFVLGLLTIPTEVGDVSPGAAGMIAIGTVLGSISGLGSALFCRLISRARE